MREINLVEYETRFIDGLSLDPIDRRLRRELESTEPKKARLVIEERDGGLFFKASYWVGVAHFQNFSVQVKPKLVGSEHALLDMLAFSTHAFDFRAFIAKRTYQAAEDAPLVEWFAYMLLYEVETLLQHGLLSDYVEKENLLPAVRGRILYDQQILKRFGVVDKIYCRFDERTQDILENQILSLGLSIASRLVSNRILKRRLKNLVSEFGYIANHESLNRKDARRISHNSLNVHYRDAHNIVFLLMDNVGLDSFYDSGDTRGTSFFLNMITIFEKFVTRLTKVTLGKRFRVDFQHRDASIIRYSDGEPYREIRPDVLVQERSTRRYLPIDAKYKLFDDKKISSADIYQLSFHANAYNEEGLPAALIIYPKPEGHKVDVLHLQNARKLEMGRLVTLGIDIPAFLESNRLNESPAEVRRAFTSVDLHPGS